MPSSSGPVLNRCVVFGLFVVVAACEGVGEGAITSEDDEVGDSGPGPGGCAPSFNDDDSGEAVYHECQGEGVGYAVVTVELSPTVYACGTYDTDNIAVCEANPLDLTALGTWTDEEIGAPAACCDPESADVEDACVWDCAFAACKLGARKLHEAAEGETSLFGNPKGDLHELGTKLETDLLHDCANLVRANAPNYAEISVGEGGGAVVIGHILNATLHLRCDVTAAEVAEPPEECTDAIHQEEEPANSVGVVELSAVTVSPPYGPGSIAVLDQDYAVRAPNCGTPPCSFSLRQLDLELDDTSLSSFDFENIAVELDSIASGSRTGTAVTFGTGALVLNVSVVPSVGGDYLFGTTPYTFQFGNVGPVSATWSGGVFKILDAPYALGDAEAILNTEPPV